MAITTTSKSLITLLISVLFAFQEASSQRPDVLWTQSMRHSRAVNSVSFSPDGTMLASGGDDETIKIWRVSDASIIKTIDITSTVYDAKFSKNGLLLVAAGSDSIYVWRISDWNLIKTLPQGAYSISFSSDGTMLFSSRGIWRISDWKLFVSKDFGTADVSFSPDGTIIAAAAVGGIEIWKVLGENNVRKIKVIPFDVRFLSFSPDGTMLAAGGFANIMGSVVSVFRVSDWLQINEFVESDNTYLSSLSFSPDGTMLAGIYDKFISLLRVPDFSYFITLTGHTARINSLSFSPDGTMLASSDNNGDINIWRLSDGTLIKTLFEYFEWIKSISFSPDGTMIASGSDDLTIKLWRVSDGSIIKTLKTEYTQGLITSLSFSPDGKILASCSSFDNIITLWDVLEGKILITYGGELEVRSPSSITFSADGSLFAWGGGIIVIAHNSFVTKIKYFNQNMPFQTQLSQNYPNPFNPETIIEYSVEQSRPVEIFIFNQLGQKVRTLINEPNVQQGTYHVMWDGKDENSNLLSSGTYYYQIRAGDFVSTKKAVLLK